MVVVSSTDKFIIGCVHQVKGLLDLACHLINKLLWCFSSLSSFQLDLLTMLIRTCLKAHIIALHSLESGNGICQHDLVGVSNVRLAGSVSNGRGDVIRFLHGVFLTFCRRSGLFFHSDAICAAQI